jgi:hypothetical protein
MPRGSAMGEDSLNYLLNAAIALKPNNHITIKNYPISLEIFHLPIVLPKHLPQKQ